MFCHQIENLVHCVEYVHAARMLSMAHIPANSVPKTTDMLSAICFAFVFHFLT